MEAFLGSLIGLLIPICAILATVVIVAVALKQRGRRRELLHKERLAAIEKGIEIPEVLLVESDSLSPKACLLRGLSWLLVGVSIGIFFVAMGVAEGDRETVAVATLGLIPLGVGIAYLIVYRKLEADRALSSEGAPRPK